MNRRTFIKRLGIGAFISFFVPFLKPKKKVSINGLTLELAESNSGKYGHVDWDHYYKTISMKEKWIERLEIASHSYNEFPLK